MSDVLENHEMVDDFLAHYGVKGMRWGVRRDSSTPRLTRRERLEKAYSMKYSEAVAKTKVDARLRTEKILLISGGVLATAAIAAVVGKNLHTQFAPVNLKVGTQFQNINNVGGKFNKDDVLFTTFKNSDNRKYAKKFVDEFLGRGNKVAYATTLKNNVPIKAPSRSQTEKLYQAWRKSQGLGDRKYSMYLRDLQASPAVSQGANSFVAYLKKQGYNALQDRLDQSGSYKAQMPLMVFEGSQTLTSFGSKVVKDILNK